MAARATISLDPVDELSNGGSDQVTSSEDGDDTAYLGYLRPSARETIDGGRLAMTRSTFPISKTQALNVTIEE